MSDFVNVPVPVSLVPEVYGLIARRTTGSGSPHNGREAAGPYPGWDDSLLRRAYRESPPAMKMILGEMARRAGEELGANDFVPLLAKHRGKRVSRSGVSGTFGAFGRRVQNRYGREHEPYDKRYDHERREKRYRMPQRVAEVILEEATNR